MILNIKQWVIDEEARKAVNRYNVYFKREEDPTKIGEYGEIYTSDYYKFNCEILKETKNALYVSIPTTAGKRWKMWIAKSQIEEYQQEAAPQYSGDDILRQLRGV